MNEPGPRRADRPPGSAREAALGDVARDVMDHASMIVRDRVEIARLEARRWKDHLARDVAPRALFAVGAALCALLALTAGLVALFLALAAALGSVAWTFLIFAGLFVLAGVVMAGFYTRSPVPLGAEDIARRFPAVRSEPARPEHALVRQEHPEAHRMITAEAAREAEPSRSGSNDVAHRSR